VTEQGDAGGVDNECSPPQHACQRADVQAENHESRSQEERLRVRDASEAAKGERNADERN
jgi:hypothetical protein